MNALSIRRQIVALWLVAAALRIWTALHMAVSTDVAAIVADAVTFYHTGKLSPVGARIVYTGTNLPGSLQDLWIGIPLYLFQGSVRAAVIVMSVLISLALALVLKGLRELFPQAPPRALAAWIFFCPWGFYFLELWNPNFAFLYGVLFFWAFLRIQKSGDGIAWFAAAFSVISIMQLHLSFVIPGIISFGMVARRRFRVPWGWIFGGVLVGGLTLIPFFMHLDQVHGGMIGFVFDNFYWNMSKLEWIPIAVTRFWSFPTGDLFRFISEGHGYGRALKVSLTQPGGYGVIVAIATVFISIYTLYMMWFSARFEYRVLRHWKRSSPLDRFVAALPVWVSCLFLFSVKNPAAQTLWILMPFSFYPMIREGYLESSSRRHVILAMIYVVVSHSFGITQYVNALKHPIGPLEARVKAAKQGGPALAPDEARYLELFP